MKFLRGFYLSLFVTPLPAIFLAAWIQLIPSNSWSALSSRPKWPEVVCVIAWLALSSLFTPRHGTTLLCLIQRVLVFTVLLLLGLVSTGWIHHAWQSPVLVLVALSFFACLLGTTWMSRRVLKRTSVPPNSRTSQNVKPTHFSVWLIGCAVGIESLYLGSFGGTGVEKYDGTLSWLIWFGCALPIQIIFKLFPRLYLVGLLYFAFSALFLALYVLPVAPPLLSGLWLAWLTYIIYKLGIHVSKPRTHLER